MKAQKEKASGKSLDLSKAFISSVLYIFLEVDCIKMRFYTSAYMSTMLQFSLLEIRLV